jgi:hypothetical protein
MQMEESDKQPANTECPTVCASCELQTNVTDGRAVQSAKDCLWRMSTVEGMRIVESDVHNRRVQSSIRENREPESNVTVERERHSTKQDEPRVSTEEGMQIDQSDAHKANAPFSIHETREPDSNVPIDSDWH